MEGASKTDPRALELVKMYGSRITHFGGGNKPTDSKNESYLWKPESDSDKKLVVITPASLFVESVMVENETKTTLSIGNGFRPTWRFSKNGGSGYGANPSVSVAPLGTAKISNPSKKQTFKI